MAGGVYTAKCFTMCLFLSVLLELTTVVFVAFSLSHKCRLTLCTHEALVLCRRVRQITNVCTLTHTQEGGKEAKKRLIFLDLTKNRQSRPKVESGGNRNWALSIIQHDSEWLFCSFTYLLFLDSIAKKPNIFTSRTCAAN